MTDFVERLGAMVISPRETLEQLSKERALRDAFIVVLLAGAFAGILLGMLLPRMMPPELIPLIPLDFTGLFILGLTSTLLSWVIYVGILHLVAKLIGGKGEYSMLLHLIGYAYVPYLLIYPLSLVTWFISPLLSSLIDLIGFVWYCVLTIFAISIAERFSILRAAITVVGSVVAIIVLAVVVIALMAIAGIPLA
ncbi:MAG: YIP1 family protein [Methanophagales archaeon]|nr:YIP1 family protein [Methanophagales archaeon]